MLLTRSRLLASPLVHGGGIKSAAPAAPEVVQQASATSTAETINAPADIQAGDLLVLLDLAVNSGTAPTTVVPAGWTSVVNTLADGDLRMIMSVKLADGSEASSTITGMVGSILTNKGMLTFRRSPAATTVTPESANGQGTTGDPSPQTVTASAGTAPLVVLGGYAAPAITVRGMTPAKDGELQASTIYLAWKIYNENPQNVTVDKVDDGSVNILQSCYIEMGAS